MGAFVTTVHAVVLGRAFAAHVVVCPVYCARAVATAVTAGIAVAADAVMIVLSLWPCHLTCVGPYMFRSYRRFLYCVFGVKK